jgi:hypothetical protein
MAKILFVLIVAILVSSSVCRPKSANNRQDDTFSSLDQEDNGPRHRRYVGELNPSRGEVIADTLKYPDHTFIFVPFYTVRRFYARKERIVT